jgi:hypothetical protein
MKTILFESIVIWLMILTYSCSDNAQGTLNYNRLQFDTNRIAIFKWDTTKYLFPNNSDPLPLMQGDLLVIDSLLHDAIDSFNAKISPGIYQAFDRNVPLDSFIIKQINYKYQLFPYKDVNGQKIVSIIGFSRSFSLWKEAVYMGRLHYGIQKMELKINLSEKTRDNIQSGDYG